MIGKEEKIEDNNYLIATIDRIEGETAVIRLENYQELIWPIDRLPENFKEGTVFRLLAKESLSNEEEKRSVAKEMLREIFNQDE